MEITTDLLVRNLAHDVRTPLNAITGFAMLLDSEHDGPLTPKQREYVSRIQRAAKRADSILDSLLHLARVREGSLVVRAEPTPVKALVRQLLDEQAGVVEDAGVRVEADLQEVGELTTDPELLQRVLSNLISNAIKYNSTPGVVMVGLERVGAESSPLHRDSVAIRVADTGPGITSEDQDKVFKEFVRLPATQGERGSGLGLAIARRIARVLGGELLLNSAPRVGSEFTVWLPFERRQVQGVEGEPSAA